jgi:hypothetical protein
MLIKLSRPLPLKRRISFTVVARGEGGRMIAGGGLTEGSVFLRRRQQSFISEHLHLPIVVITNLRTLSFETVKDKLG